MAGLVDNPSPRAERHESADERIVDRASGSTFLVRTQATGVQTDCTIGRCADLILSQPAGYRSDGDAVPKEKRTHGGWDAALTIRRDGSPAGLRSLQTNGPRGLLHARDKDRNSLVKSIRRMN